MENVGETPYKPTKAEIQMLEEDLKKEDDASRRDRAIRAVKSLGIGFNIAAGIHDKNLMDKIVSLYVDGHYVPCIALCRIRAELALREFIYLEDFIETDADAKRGIRTKMEEFSEHYVKTSPNLKRILQLEYMCDHRVSLSEKLDNIIAEPHTKNKRCFKDCPFGTLIRIQRDKLEQLGLYKIARRIRKMGNRYVHSHELEAEEGLAEELMVNTAYFMNRLFINYTTRPVVS